MHIPTITDCDVVQLTSQLVRIPSVNPMGRAFHGETYFEHRMTDFLEKLFERWNLTWERHVVISASGEVPDRENILGRLPNSNPDAPILMFEVHQDTVPVDGMSIDPWCGDLRDGKVFGRGACDIKGGMAAQLAAVARLSQLPDRERPNLVVACTVNEEHGFDGAAQLASLASSGASRLLPRAPDAVVVAEPTLLQVVVAHKGALRWRLHTLGKAAHSSAPSVGHNAIYDMGRVVQALEEFSQQVLPGLPEHPMLGAPTLSVGTIQGGISINTVPDRCTIEIDRRIAPHEDLDEEYERVKSYLSQRFGDQIQIEHERPLMQTPGLENRHNQDLARQLVDAVRATGRASEAIGVPYGTDAATLAAAGLPSVVFGPGDAAQAHTADEWVSTEQLLAATDVLVEFARNFTA